MGKKKMMRLRDGDRKTRPGELAAVSRRLARIWIPWRGWGREGKEWQPRGECVDHCSFPS